MQKYDPQLISISEAAEILGVSVDTIRRWDAAGKISAHRSSGGHRLFNRTELEAYKAQLPLTTSEAAAFLGISPTKLRSLERQGRIEPDRDEQGNRRYTKQLIANYQERKDFPKEPSPVFTPPAEFPPSARLTRQANRPARRSFSAGGPIHTTQSGMSRLILLLSSLALVLVVITRTSNLATALTVTLIVTLISIVALKKYLPQSHSLSTLLFPGSGATFAQSAPKGTSGEVLISYHSYQQLHTRLKTSAIVITLALASILLGLKVLPVLSATLLLPVIGVASLAGLWAAYSLLSLAPRGERINAIKALVRTDPRIAFARYAPTENTGALKVGYTTYKKLYRAASLSLAALILLVAIGLGREIYLARMSADQNFRAASTQFQAVLNTLKTGQGNLAEELSKLAAQSLQTAPTIDETSLTQRIVDQVTGALPEAPTEIVKETTQTITERTIVQTETAQSIQLEGSGQYVVKDNRGVTIFAFGPDNDITATTNSLFDIQGAWNINGIRVTTNAPDLNDLPTLLNDTRFLVTQGNDTLDQERILTAGSGITLTDSGANNAFTISSNPATLTLTTGTTDTDATPGSVFFAGAGGVIQQDNANFFYDDTNNMLGIGTASPDHLLDINGAAHIYNGAVYISDTSTADDWHIIYDATLTGLNFTETGVASNRLFLKDGGNVGIGTSTPDTALDVSSSNNTSVISQSTSNTKFPEFRIVHPGAQWALDIESTTDALGIRDINNSLIFVIEEGAPSGSFRINSSGNVGIGDTSPVALLTVGSGDLFQVGSDGRVNVGTNASGAVATLDTVHATGSGLTIDIQSSSASQYALKTTSSNTAITGLYVGGDGHVGIGTTAPTGTGSTVLQVAGTGGGASQYGSLSLSNASNSGGNFAGSVDYYAGGNLAAAVRGQLVSGSNVGQLIFYTATTGGVLGGRWTIQNDGKLINSSNSNSESAGTVATAFALTGQNATNTIRLMNLVNGATSNNSNTEIGFTSINASAAGIDVAAIRAIKSTSTAGAEVGQLAFYTRNAGTLQESVRFAGDGNVGIGTTAPNFKLEAAADQATNIISSTGYGTGFYGEFVGRAARGTLASPTTTTADDVLAVFAGRGHDSAWSSVDNGRIAIVAGAGVTWNGSSHPTDIVFSTTAESSLAVTERMRLSSTGQLNLAGNGTIKNTGGSAFILMGPDANSQISIGHGTGTTYQGYLHTFNESGVGEVMRIDGGNVGINTTTAGASCVACLALASSTAPSASITDGIQLFAVDIAGSHELRVRDEAGNVTTLSPHNFSLFQPDQDYYLPWSYTSERDNQAINVDMYGAIQQIELISGKHFIYGKDLNNGDTFTPTNLTEILSVPEAFEELDIRFAAIEERLAAVEASPLPNQGEGQGEGTSDPTVPPTPSSLPAELAGPPLLPVQGEGNADLDLNSLIIRTDVTVYGTLLTDTLEIATALNLHSDATIWGTLLVKGDVDFEANARVAGSLTRGNEQTGVIAIPAHARQVRVTFPEPFAAELSDPVITVSPENTFTAIAVFAVSKTSFELHIAENNPLESSAGPATGGAGRQSIKVRWSALVSPSTTAATTIEVIDTFSDNPETPTDPQQATANPNTTAEPPPITKDIQPTPEPATPANPPPAHY